MNIQITSITGRFAWRYYIEGCPIGSEDYITFDEAKFFAGKLLAKFYEGIHDMEAHSRARWDELNAKSGSALPYLPYDYTLHVRFECEYTER